MTDETKPKLTPEEAAKKAAEAIMQIMKDAGVELEAPEFFVVPASVIGDVLIAGRAAIRERALKHDTHVKLRESLVSMIKEMSSMNSSEVQLIAQGLHIIEEREEWKAALDKFYGVIENT